MASVASPPVEEIQDDTEGEMLTESPEDSEMAKFVVPMIVRPPPARSLSDLKPFGSGREVLLQAFNWESSKQGDWYRQLESQAEELCALGVTAVWLPPPTASLSKEGYLPSDLYNLSSMYGDIEALKSCVAKFRSVGILSLADIVINHRCADTQDEHGVWNTYNYGGKLAWGPEAVVSNDDRFKGKGHVKQEDFFHAAPNVDHRQAFVREGIADWLQWLMQEVGYAGWRFDYVRGIWGPAIRQYVEATWPELVVGEYWDELRYDGPDNPAKDQAEHRERTAAWIRGTGGRAMAFDMTTKGVLQAALERGEYNRLADPSNRPTGLLGVWPSRTCLFLENHDTGSTQQHWPFPEEGIEQGHVYMLTHPGTPCLFYDHVQRPELREVVQQLLDIRRRANITSRSVVNIMKAEHRRYVAEIDNCVLMAIGPEKYTPDDEDRWEVAAQGRHWSVWERVEVA